MKTIICCGLTVAMLLSALPTFSQTKMTLTERQEALITIAANEAKGNIEGLKAALNTGFDNGLTISEAKEAL